MLPTFILAAAVAASSPIQVALKESHEGYSRSLVDQFAEGDAPKRHLGESFVFRTPLKSGDSRGGPSGPFYTYSEGVLKLIFSLSEEYASRNLSGPKFPVGSVGGSKALRRSYVGSNAFGTSAKVQVFEQLQDGIAFVDGPEGEVSPFYPPDEMEFSRRHNVPIPKDDYWVGIPVSGPAARTMAKDVDLMIEGAIVPLADGKPNFCKPWYSAATVSSPREIYGSECWIGANVSRVAYVRRSTGELIKEWRKP